MSEWPNYVHVTGDWIDMGSAHGEQCRERIRELAEIRIGYLSRSYGPTSIDVIKGVCARLASDIERLLPAVYKETTATARASNIDYWMLLVAGALSDIDDLVSREFGKQRTTRPECTLIPVPLLSGGVVLSGTWDTHADAAPYHVVLRREPTGQPATLALTTFGWPMQQGVTSEGLAFAIANLVARTAGTGVPYIAALPTLATSHTLRTALQSLINLPHCSGRFYALADESDYCGVEVVPDVGVFTNRAQEPHTNHYVHTDARDWEGRPDQISLSIGRLAVATSKAMALAGSSPSELLQLYADGALTQDGRGDDDRTGATFVLSPAERALYMVGGDVVDVPAQVRRYTI